MLQWVIVIPVWGERHLRCFRDVALPSVIAALEASNTSARFLIRTDAASEAAVRVILGDLKYELDVVDGHRLGLGPHRVLGVIHGQAMRSARVGEAVCFVNADNVLSRECFVAAQTRIAQGKRMIFCAGHRTASAGDPPIGACARDLLAWVWTNRHPWISDCIWGSGQSAAPAMLHFVNGDDVITRAFHLHPFCVFKDGRDLSFYGVTADDDLAQRFKVSEIHVVTDRDEMAMGEMSPAEQPSKYPRFEHPIAVADVVAWGQQYKPKNRRYRVNDRHRYNFAQRIVIQGSGADHGDVAICEKILASI